MKTVRYLRFHVASYEKIGFIERALCWFLYGILQSNVTYTHPVITITQLAEQFSWDIMLLMNNWRRYTYLQ